MATGPYHWLKLHETHMQSQPFMIDGVAANGQKFQQPLYGMLEPIRFYRYIFPEAGLPIVAKTLLADTNNPLYDKLKVQLWAMRKMIGLKEVPKTGLPDVKMGASVQHLQIIPIGIKEDVTGIMAPTGVLQEKL